MEPPEPFSAKFKLWRWLLLLSVITVALGGLVLWNSRRERLQFVEPIWSDSLVGQEKDSAATVERRKIGEVWSVTRFGGLTFWGRGLSRELEGRYPVFTPANQFQQSLSELLLVELRGSAAVSTEIEWSDWWACVKKPPAHSYFKFNRSYKVLFVSELAVSLCELEADSSWGRSFVNRDGRLHEIQIEELFDDIDWLDAISNLVAADLRQQGVELKQYDNLPHQRSYHPNWRVKNHVLDGFERNESNFVLIPRGLWIHIPAMSIALPFDREYDSVIAWELLNDHLRRDGPHRLFQTKVSE